MGGPGFFKRLAGKMGIPPGFPSGNSKLIINIIVIVIASRLLLYIIGYLGIMLFANQAAGLIDSFQPRWYKADSPLYLNIAKNWYVNYGDDRFLIVFYPLYSILMRVFSYLIPDYFWAGMAVSAISLIFACIYLYKLTQLDFDEHVAFDSVKYLLIFPFSFFLGLVFSDTLFLALTVMTFYYMRKRKWLLTGLLGGLAGLTRNFGILLLVPAVIEYLAATKFVEMLKAKNWKRIFSDFMNTGSDLLLIPLGQFIYMFINKVVTGSWFTFLTYQREHWSNGLNLNIAENLTSYVNNAFTWNPEDAACMWIPLIVLVFSVILLAFYGLRKIRISYIAYVLAYLFTCLCATWLISGPRYIMGLFPIYIILALLSKNRFRNFIITFISLLLLCCYAIAYIWGLNIY